MDKLKFSLMVVTVTVLCACTTSTPYLDSRFGYTVNTAKALQTINPEASRNTDPVAGLDGNSAKESIDRYQDSFKAPQRTFDIFLGTSGGGGR